MTEITKRGLMVGAVSLMAAGTAVGKTTFPPRRPPVLDDRVYEVAKPKTWTMSVKHVNPWGWETEATKAVDVSVKRAFKLANDMTLFEEVRDRPMRERVRAAVESQLRYHVLARDITDVKVTFDDSNNPREMTARGDMAIDIFLMGGYGGFTFVRMLYADEDAVRAHA